MTEFDRYAQDYDAALERGISVSGESKEFFARGRIAWLRRVLPPAPAPLGLVLDYGCGTGTAAPLLMELLCPRRLLGVDVSAKSVEVARRMYGSDSVSFQDLAQPLPEAGADLAFCNGVFHHIPEAERAAALALVHGALRPGGLFAFWENNPWNLGTQIVMARIPFDREAVKISPPRARRLLREAGFTVLRTDFQFVFPHALRACRRWEPALARLPLGAQYQVLARKGSA